MSLVAFDISSKHVSCDIFDKYLTPLSITECVLCSCTLSSVTVRLVFRTLFRFFDVDNSETIGRLSAIL